VTPTPGALVRAAWGSRGARPPLFDPPQRRDLVVHRTAMAALKSTNGPGASSVARAAVLRLDGQHPGKRLTATRLDVANQHRKETKEEKRVEWPVGLLTVGRRWSRGRLGGEVYEGGVGVHAGGRPPRLLLLVPSWFTSSSLRRGAAPCSGSALPVPDVPQQRRTGGDASQDLLLLRLHFSRSPPFCPLGGAHTGLGKTPMRVGGMRLRSRGSL
jgi:hypothetical protein